MQAGRPQGDLVEQLGARACLVTWEARGLGVGRALITRVKAHATAHGGGELRWFTEADNTTAQRLYDTLATKSSWVVYEDLVTGEN